MKNKTNQIPPEITNAVADVIEKTLFPHPAKRLWGKIGRFAFKIAKMFMPQ